MKTLRTVVTGAIAVCMLTAVAYAHEIKGTVVSATPASVTVSVVDESTKKATSTTFDLNKDTKIYRGTKVVTFADAHILKGDKISITIDHELDEKLAVIVKLDASKAPGK